MKAHEVLEQEPAAVSLATRYRHAAQLLTGIPKELLGNGSEAREAQEAANVRRCATRVESKTSQGETLAGALWYASVGLVGGLFQDYLYLYGEYRDAEFEEVPWEVLHTLPPTFRRLYDPEFVEVLTMRATAMTALLTSGWEYPHSLAETLLTHALLEQVEVIADLDELNLPDDWRSVVETYLLPNTEYKMLYLDRGSQPSVRDCIAFDIRHWFLPYVQTDSLPPMVAEYVGTSSEPAVGASDYPR